MANKQKRDFSIKKGTKLVGKNKPNKVAKKNVRERTVGHALAGRDDKFGNRTA